MSEIKERLYAKAGKDRIPLSGAFEISPVCNFSCKMCYVRRTPQQAEEYGGIKPLEYWLRAAEEAKNAGTLFPLLTGGEVFLYPYIKELYTAMCNMGMQVSVNSNASCITQETISWLKENPPVRINVTLYGGSNEGYERLCGDAHGFDKVKKGIQLLDENGIRFRFNCSLTPYNCDELEKMMEFADSYGKKLRIATYMFPPERRTGKFGDYEDRLRPEQAAYYQAFIDWKYLEPIDFAILAQNSQMYKELTDDMLADMQKKPKGEMKCRAGRCSYWIDWCGNIRGCGMMSDELKLSLEEYSLKDAWQKIAEYTNDFRYSSICSNCVNRSVCYCCAAMIYNEVGNYDDRPVYICQMRKYAAKYYKEFMDKLPKDILKEAEKMRKTSMNCGDDCGLE